MDPRQDTDSGGGDPLGKGNDMPWRRLRPTGRPLAVRGARQLDCAMRMKGIIAGITLLTCSGRTRHAELLRLCARIGYSPPALS